MASSIDEPAKSLFSGGATAGSKAVRPQVHNLFKPVTDEYYVIGYFHRGHPKSTASPEVLTILDS